MCRAQVSIGTVRASRFKGGIGAVSNSEPEIIPSAGPPRRVDRSQHRSAQARAFNELGDRYATQFPNKQGQIHAGAWLIGRLDRAARVLDVGCGTGVPTARQLADAGLQVVGIDISPTMLALAAELVPEATFRNVDALDIAESGFDAAVAFFSLMLLPRHEIEQSLAVLHEVVKPGGYLALGMVEADLDDAPITFMGTEVRISGYPRNELRRVVAGAGFEVLKIEAVTYVPDMSDPEIQLYVYCRKPAS